MNLEKLLTTRGITWEGVQEYETNAGKLKEALHGTPHEGKTEFWSLWKENKESMKAIPGFSLSYTVETVSAARMTSTGRESSRGGYRQGTRQKKFWLIRININRRTEATIRGSFPIPSDHSAEVHEMMAPGGGDVDAPF